MGEAPKSSDRYQPSFRGESVIAAALRLSLKRVTVISDASHCPNTRACGWAGGVVLPTGVVRVTGGVIERGFAGNNSAEAYAMTSALLWAIDQKMVRSGDRVLLLTDNLHLFERVQQNPRPNRVWGRDSMTDFRSVASLALEHGFAHEVEYIKGHTRSEDRRGDLHAQVMSRLDRISRAHMKQSRMEVCRALSPVQVGA